MKVSDYIIRRLEEHGVRDVFLLSGGGMMHLLDSLFRSEVIHPWCNLHEQASSICASAYAQATGRLGVCMVTSGPGATNAVTGAVDAWIDSEPVLVISGQAKTSDLVGDRGVRQCGSQEVDITAMVRPVTKYAVSITDKTLVKYHLDKAVYLAAHGRKGTVWVEVPLDIQGAQVEESELVEFDPAAEGLVSGCPVSDEDVGEILDMLRAAKRPVVLVGKGVLAGGVGEQMRDLCHNLQVPALATWCVKTLFGYDDPLFFGFPGGLAPRYSNWILQTCDFLLIVGSRLNQAVTAFNESHFACRAKRVIVDIDANEIKKLHIDFTKALVCDTADFVPRLYRDAKGMGALNTAEWLRFCRKAKTAFPAYQETQPKHQEQTNMYLFGHKLSLRTRADDVIVGSSSGRASVIPAMSYEFKAGQTEVCPSGLGSMGLAVPSAIGACVAGSKRRTIVLEGDGSLQHNLQELALIQGYGLPIKLFIMNNNGYSSIAVMQENHFKGRYAGCNRASGVCSCDMEKLAALYDLPYYEIRGDGDIDSVLDLVMADDKAVLCNVLCDYTFDEIPKAMSRLNPDGSMSSSVLEDLYPFLPKEETEKWLRMGLGKDT
ncbi:MAG: thiamine pyrophosphate-binding protein [Oscillibacter sp.]|jgi:acetolactate synthase-1/2/3 large subunit|nr:thiamine pyrophosphate-binding protein [Oscillibacter sp.]